MQVGSGPADDTQEPPRGLMGGSSSQHCVNLYMDDWDPNGWEHGWEHGWEQWDLNKLNRILELNPLT